MPCGTPAAYAYPYLLPQDTLERTQGVCSRDAQEAVCLLDENVQEMVFAEAFPQQQLSNAVSRPRKPLRSTTRR